MDIIKDSENEKMLEGLLQFIKELLNENYSFKPRSSDFNGIYRELYDSILEMRNKMRHYVFEVQVASSQVTSATNELTVALDENTEIMQQIFNEAKEIQQLNLNSQNTIFSSMDEFKKIAILLQDVKSTSDKVKLSSEQSQYVLNESMQEIFEIVGAVGNIKESTDNTVEYIKKLGESTSQIKDILQSVNDISRKTHIISLNASIESARAGLAGRAFAVLSEEIRILAGQSRDAVNQISDLISRVTDEMEHLDLQMREDLVNVQKSVDCSKNVEVSLERIENTYVEVQNMVDTITSATEEENRLAEGIVRNTSQIESISLEVSNGFEKVYDSVHKQKHTMEDISGLGVCLAGASNSLTILTQKTTVNLIDEYAEKFSNVAENVIRILREEVLAEDEFKGLQADIHEKLLNKVLEKYNIIEAVWSNNKKGKFIYSNPAAGIANAKVRDWFKASIVGEQFISELYISAITKNPCITVSLPIQDSEGGIIGVVGADLRLHI